MSHLHRRLHASTFTFWNAFLSACAGFILLASSIPAVHGQSALDGFDPSANGSVFAIVVQPDGKILIGGAFTTLSPNGGPAVSRNRIARLNADGTLDTTFNPNADNDVYVIAVQSDGKVLIGGLFRSVGGEARTHFARLDAATGHPDSFNPSPNSTVYAIAFQADGKILVGGGFTNIGKQTRAYFARLDPSTGLADSLDAHANGLIRRIITQPDGRILVCGGFIMIGGEARKHIARLDATSGRADSFNPNANNFVMTIALQADGKVLAGGNFSGANSIGGQTRNNIARLDASTGLADSFDPNASNPINDIVVQPDGRILVGSPFGLSNTIGGQTRNGIARLDPATGLADSFHPAMNSSVFEVAVQQDGKILIGGSFNGPNSIGNQTRNHLARLERDGRLDQTLDINAVGSWILAIAVQPDRKILIGGLFNTVLGQPRNNIARLNSDGTLDTGFNPNANGVVNSIAVQADGKILAAGEFTSVGGQTRSRIARLESATGMADSFNPEANSDVNSIAVQPDGKILVGGQFTAIGGQPRRSIARLDGTTGLADSFDPNAIGTVFSIAVQPDGQVLAAGFFHTIGGQPRNNIARLDAATGVADSFNPSANNMVRSIVLQSDGKVVAAGAFNTIGGQPRAGIARLDAATGAADSFEANTNDFVYSIAVQSDGKVLAVGPFTTIGGQPRNRIARLDGATGAVDSFDPNPSNSVFSVAVQADGKVLAGGRFTSMAGQSRNLFARLSNDTAALTTLSVTATAITLTRAGSAPQFSRVVFEQSVDNGATWTLLGPAAKGFAFLADDDESYSKNARHGAVYSFGGQDLPVEQNILIRARGFYTTGYLCGSEAIEDVMQNAFLLAPLQLTSALSRKTHGSAGDFGIALPLAGEPGVECRWSGGAHMLIFTFSNNVVRGDASVTTGNGSVSGSPTFAGNSMTVNLTGVTDVQRITVTLSGVTDSLGQVLPDAAMS